jgi:hypothetical protein
MFMIVFNFLFLLITFSCALCNLCNQFLNVDILCSSGWHEALCIVTSVYVGFICMSISMYSCLLVRFKSKYSICFLFSVVIVNFISFCCLLNCSNICSELILLRSYMMKISTYLRSIIYYGFRSIACLISSCSQYLIKISAIMLGIGDPIANHLLGL